MAVSPIFSTAVSGLNASARKAQSAADNIANVLSEDYTARSVATSTVITGEGADVSTSLSAQLIGSEQPVDLASEIIRLREAEITYRANAAVIRTASELSKETLSIKA